MGRNTLIWRPVNGGKLVFIGYKYPEGETGITVSAEEASAFGTQIINHVFQVQSEERAHRLAVKDHQ